MIRFFKKLFKRGDFMTRADKAYYKYRAKTIFWSAFCMIIIAWVGTNLVLCALTTNVESNFDMIYEAEQSTVLPIGKEMNKTIANISAFERQYAWHNDYRYAIASITFDKYNDDGKYMVGNVDIVAACNTSDKMVKVNDDVTLYRMNNEQMLGSYKGQDIYILSSKKIQANPDSSFMFYCFANCKTYSFKNFDTSLVTNMIGMFAGDSHSISWPSTASILQENGNKKANTLAAEGNSYVNGVKNLDLSDWKTSNVTNMFGMFYNCGDLESVNFGGWDTKNVTDMSQMFNIRENDPQMQTLDLSSFDTSAVQSYANMFYKYSSNLKTVYVSDRWNIPASVLPSGCSYVQKEYTGK